MNRLVFLTLDSRMAHMPSTMKRPETTPPGSRLYHIHSPVLRRIRAPKEQKKIKKTTFSRCFIFHSVIVADVCKFPCVSCYTYSPHLVLHGEESWSSKWKVGNDTKDEEGRNLSFLIISASWESMTPSFAALWCPGRTIDCGCQEGGLNTGSNLTDIGVGWSSGANAVYTNQPSMSQTSQWAILSHTILQGIVPLASTCQHWLEIGRLHCI